MTREIAQMSEEWRVMLNCNESLAAYLRDVSSKTNSQFFAKVCLFVILYRECLNQYGWQKLAEAEVRETRLPTDESNI